MHYIAKHQNFSVSTTVKCLSICFLLVAPLITGCDEDDDETRYTEDTNRYGDDSRVAVPVPGAVVLGAIGLTFAGWKLRRSKRL
jgi:hypothetical protein